MLCLRGGREHWGLKLSQFEFGDEKDANGEGLLVMWYILRMVPKIVLVPTKIERQIK